MGNVLKNIPSNVLNLLQAADAKHGFPKGTMASLMQQEIGGNMKKFLSDPTAYHYAPNAEGKRIAAHTGKISTAFGPFGLLESTAAKPGYGVAPLKDKSLEEQVRFASDYLAARSKRSGGLVAGLAGYGEGAGYAQKVASRAGFAPLPQGKPEMTAAASVPAAQPTQVVTASAPAPVAQRATVEVPPPGGSNLWSDFLAQANGPAQNQAPRAVARAPQYEMPQMNVPDFMGLVSMAEATKPKTTPFASLSTWGIR